MDEKLKRLIITLLYIGITPDLKGYHVLLDIFKSLSQPTNLESQRMIETCMIPYPNAENAIRYSIENAYNIGKLQKFNNLVGKETLPDKPSVKQFLCILYEYYKYFL